MEVFPHYLEDLHDELNAIADRPLTPSRLRRFFLLLTRGHWSDAANFGPDLEDTLRCCVWAPGSEQLAVELQGTVQRATLQHSIWVTVGNFQAKQISFGNRSVPDENNATESYTMPVSCELLWRHDAPSLDMAFDMAWSTFCFLMGFQEAILTGLGPESAAFTLVNVGSPILAEPSPKERFVVDVGARLGVNIAVATTLESHVLKRIALTTAPSL